MPRDSAAAHLAPEEDLDGEVVDGVPVLDERRSRIVQAARVAQAPARLRSAGSSPAVQAAAAAAGGFVAGAAVLGLVQRRQRRSSALARAQRPTRLTGRRGSQVAGGVGELVQIVASRSLLVDVHLLAGPTPPAAR
jgi:hypothetical protein